MNKSETIYLDTGNTINDKHIKIRLENENDTLEVLTLKIDTKNIYRDFNSDYGVLVGRVNANDGIGIPNVKISIFIPLEESDEDNSDIVSIYPYKTPRDKNVDGKRYNLLPRVSEVDVENGIIRPKQPFGSFPIKPEIVTNSKFLDVYKKYYKYTAITNEFGDYMIFGVPIGTQIVHLSVDITDIGKYSMTPAAMVTNLGYSPNLFTDNNTKIKPSKDLNDLPQIETQEISVSVIPFWGDKENFEIGITRQDFRIRAQLTNTFVIFGSVFTDGSNSMWGENHGGGREPRELYRARDDANKTIAAATKRIGKVTEKIYYYPNSIPDEDINNADPKTDMILLDPSNYSVYKRDGDFVFIINCNRRKIITGLDGKDIIVENNSNAGVFTEFVGFITLEITQDNVPMDFSGEIGTNATVFPFRYKIKIPQNAPKGHTFSDANDEKTDAWRKQNYTFSGGTYYTVSKFNSIVFNDTEGDSPFYVGNFHNGFYDSDDINNPHHDPFWNTTIIQTNDTGGVTGNSLTEIPTNVDAGSRNYFAANWLNFSVYLPQMGHLTNANDRVVGMRSGTNFSINTKNDFFFKDNTQIIAAHDFNTKHFARSDLHYTDFASIPKKILKSIADETRDVKGFKLSDLSDSELKDEIRVDTGFKNGENLVPENGGKINGEKSNGTDTDIYFYKGFDTANCIEYIELLGLL